MRQARRERDVRYAGHRGTFPGDGNGGQAEVYHQAEVLEQEAGEDCGGRARRQGAEIEERPEESCHRPGGGEEEG